MGCLSRRDTGRGNVGSRTEGCDGPEVGGNKAAVGVLDGTMDSEESD